MLRDKDRTELTATRRARGVGALLGLVVALAVPAGAAVEKKTDRFTGETTVNTLYIPDLGFKPQLFLVAKWEGKKRVSTVALGVYLGSKEWRYLDCPHLHWIGDGQRVSTGEAIHQGSVGEAGVVEFVLAPKAPVDALKQLAYSRKVEFKVCNDEFVLTEKEMADLRGVYAEVSEHNRVVGPRKPL